LRRASELIIAGNFAGLQQQLPAFFQRDASGLLAHAAVTHGFGMVMLYGGIGVWILAALSFTIFGSDRHRREAGASLENSL